MDQLVPLFRYCKIKRIDQILEFQLSRPKVHEGTSPAESLYESGGTGRLRAHQSDVTSGQFCGALGMPETPAGRCPSRPCESIRTASKLRETNPGQVQLSLLSSTNVNESISIVLEPADPGRSTAAATEMEDRK
jgi:hypothetical protein